MEHGCTPHHVGSERDNWLLHGNRIRPNGLGEKGSSGSGAILPYHAQVRMQRGSQGWRCLLAPDHGGGSSTVPCLWARAPHSRLETRSAVGRRAGASMEINRHGFARPDHPGMLTATQLRCPRGGPERPILVRGYAVSAATASSSKRLVRCSILRSTS
jgi:hypothetical protein